MYQRRKYYRKKKKPETESEQPELKPAENESAEIKEESPVQPKAVEVKPAEKKPEIRTQPQQPNRNQQQSKPNKLQNKNKWKKLSIVVPLYNEDESLKNLYSEIIKSLGKFSRNYEIVFVDDGSTDKSLEVIKQFARNDRNVKYVSFRKNYGKSAALNAGFARTTGDYVITMDADLQDDPAEIPSLINKLEEGHDLVSGWKKVRFDPFIKRHTSRFFNAVTRISSGINIHDFNCGLKAYKGEVTKNINIYGELHRYIPVLAAWQGYKISEVPVRHHSRKFGKTKFGISRFFKGFVDLITVIVTTRYIRRPMHLFGFLGAIAFLAGFAVSGYLSYEWWAFNKPLSNRPLLLFGMLLMIVGIQFFSTGILGEIMVHNFASAQEYVVKEEKVN